MSTAPRYPAEIGYTGLRMTADEYLALGETRERYELIDGVVFMSPSPSLRHQLLLRYLLRAMEATPAGRDALILPDTDLRLSRTKVYQPDLCAYAPGRLTTLPERLDIPPDLVVEILSPGSKPLDLITKREDYGTFGVREYWVLDPDTVTLRVWRSAAASGGGGRTGPLLELPPRSDVIECGSIPGLRVDLRELREVMGMRSG